MTHLPKMAIAQHRYTAQLLRQNGELEQAKRHDLIADILAGNTPNPRGNTVTSPVFPRVQPQQERDPR